MSQDTTKIPDQPAAPSQEEILAAAENFRAKVAAAIVPAVIVDRLSRVHGFTINTQQEANEVVKAATDLYGLKLQGLLDIPVEEPETQNPLVKAAREVQNVLGAITAQQQGDQHVMQVFLNDPEIRKDASAFLQLANA